MPEAFVIETETRTAGLAVRDRGGFRFYAAAPLFFPLDNRVFPSLQPVRSAVAALERPRRVRKAG